VVPNNLSGALPSSIGESAANSLPTHQDGNGRLAGRGRQAPHQHCIQFLHVSLLCGGGRDLGKYVQRIAHTILRWVGTNFADAQVPKPLRWRMSRAGNVGQQTQPSETTSVWK